MRFNVRALRSAPAGHRLAERRVRRQLYQFHPDAVRVREIGVVHPRCLVECNVAHRGAPLLEHRGNRRQVLHLQSKVLNAGRTLCGCRPQLNEGVLAHLDHDELRFPCRSELPVCFRKAQRLGVIFNGLIEIGYAHPDKAEADDPVVWDTLWAAAVTLRPTMVPATKRAKPRMAVSLCFESVCPYLEAVFSINGAFRNGAFRDHTASTTSPCSVRTGRGAQERRHYRTRLGKQFVAQVDKADWIDFVRDDVYKWRSFERVLAVG